MNATEARTQWASDVARLTACGIHLEGVKSYLPDEFRSNVEYAMDAQPALVSTSNAGIPAFLTTMIDPEIIKVLVSPSNGAKILGETKKGSWLDETAMFPMIERTGEVSTYGDYAENGHAGLNTQWPQRQSYLYQIVKEYGERELERAGLARIGWVSELDAAAVLILNKYQNLTYFFGVSGLQNYGLLNDPSLSAALTPATKAAGGVKWISTAGVIVATANEIYTDLQTMFIELVTQAAGLVDAQTKLVLAMSPASQVALTATNSFNVNVYDLLKKNFPNIRFETAVQYGATSASNPQGVAAGNLVQMIAEDVEGQQTGYCSYNEKLRSHSIIKAMSSFKQKVTQGTWGAIIRQPFAIAQMVGV